jgi:hypothetical protein
MKILINDTIETSELDPKTIAEAFWELDQSEQARFFNHLDKIADYRFPFQLQSITDDHGLTLAGRRVMQSIGEYSHWGLVPNLKCNPTTGEYSVE